jgi:hypothetical protein
MIAITMVTDLNDQGYVKFLVPSCARGGFSLKTLATADNNYTSHRIKDQLLALYLNQLTSDEIFVFTDAYDAFFLGDAREILEKFHKTGKKLVFSTETACWPDASLKDYYPEVESPYRYLNSGGFIGYAGFVKELLAETSVDVKPSDAFYWSNQYFWTKKYLENTDDIGLDSGCEIFNTFSPETGFAFLDGNEISVAYKNYMVEWFKNIFENREARLYNKVMKTFPSHVHYNGYSKCLMEEDILDIRFPIRSNQENVQLIYFTATELAVRPDEIK